jgi:acyl-coenzyme A synthetase/AMP-(fatty) acid ligase
MLHALQQHAQESPGRVAIREHTPSGWRATTWEELGEAARRAAFRARSLRSARHPTILVTDNTTASAAAFLGLMLAGVGTVCLERNSSYLTDEQSVVRRIGSAAVIGSPFPLTPGCPTLSYRDLLDGPGGSQAASPDAATPVYQVTSGSTGQPRLARQCLGSVTTGGELYRDIYQYTAGDKILLPVPLAHSFGMVGGLAGALASGAELLLLPRFALSALHSGLREQATVLLGTPLVYRLLTDAAPPPGTAVRLALSSGGPLSAEVAAKAERHLGRPVRQVYGSTETGLVACQTDRPEPWTEGSVGVPAPGVSCWIEPESPSRPGAAAQPGRLLVRTRTMFSGYLGDTAPAVTAGDRYDTGDVARLDERGHLYLVGRKATFINVGGRKVSPRRIERVVAQHASVREVHVFAREEHGEQSVHAAVVLTDPGDAARVLEFCRSRLMPYESPRQLHVVDGLPRNGMGKVSLPALLASITRTPAAQRSDPAVTGQGGKDE